MTAIASLRGVSKHFGKSVALHDVTFELQEGSTTVLIGPNGAGKTTLFHLLLGTLFPSHGEVRVFGEEPRRKGRFIRERIGFVPDTPDPYGAMTLRHLASFLAPQYPRWEEERLGRAITEMRIPEHTPFAELSRGQGTKAMLACALATRPRLLCLDEPFSGLDPIAREDLLRGFIDGLATEGATSLVATHDMELAARIADRVIFLSESRLVREGSLSALFGETEPSALSRRLEAMHLAPQTPMREAI